MIVEKACWERGCACYDHRFDEGVRVNDLSNDDLIEMFENIIEGCRSVKNTNDIHKDVKTLATLVIRDCNIAIRKIKGESDAL